MDAEPDGQVLEFAAVVEVQLVHDAEPAHGDVAMLSDKPAVQPC
ncbi:hypothetical protein OIE75_32050 [Streptomyces sp. NBC_01723]|nr:hypothetical protein [Streptomyces sp. NBC_01723]